MSFHNKQLAFEFPGCVGSQTQEVGGSYRNQAIQEPKTTTDNPFGKPVFIQDAVVAGVKPMRGKPGHEKGKKDVQARLGRQRDAPQAHRIAHCCSRQCYDELGIHREAYGNKTKKWEAFRNKFTQELLAEHKILLQGGTNEGRQPTEFGDVEGLVRQMVQDLQRICSLI
jgi:hypothetical protein